MPGLASVSYSIEGEDVVVDRLLQVFVMPEGRTGFYVDIGAYHPVLFSNTFAFYCKNWRGLCVDPNPHLADEFVKTRPRDRFVSAGIAGQSGDATYHEWTYAQINGFYDDGQVEMHKASGQTHLGATLVPMLSPRDLLASVNEEIDFLTLDAEGMEPEILRAWDWQDHRPKVICVEIHTGDIRDAVNSETAYIIREQGYTMISRIWHNGIFVDTRFAQTHPLFGGKR